MIAAEIGVRWLGKTIGVYQPGHTFPNSGIATGKCSGLEHEKAGSLVCDWEFCELDIDGAG